MRLRARRHPVIGRRRAASLPARIGGGCAGCDACDCEHGPRAARLPAAVMPSLKARA
ncbi:hypothetical protein BURPS305_6317 [Burkholderia pseudomallei 305]|nr:hypothetical protein BURPS305_6317 [Burkholderia pseudomallei 305]